MKEIGNYAYVNIISDLVINIYSFYMNVQMYVPYS